MELLVVPKKATLVIGKGEGKTHLTAFDKALLSAGIGNYNLLKVSSILPPHVEITESFSVPLGALLPVAYGSLTSEEPGQRIAAAIGIGIPVNPEEVGLIMEFTGYCSAKEAMEIVEDMVRESFEMRNQALKEVRSKAIEHIVEKIGCVIAATVLWG